MCNDYRNQLTADQIATAFSEIRLPLTFPSGVPNREPREDIRITDTAPVVRLNAAGEAELVQLRWSWPGPGGKPVYNFRSEGRQFASGRCLIPADAFYEFTDPEPPAPKRAKKIKWAFTLADEPWFCIAGLWRPSPAGEAFTMLTTDPGPDVAPYHSRQIVVLRKADWRAWLMGEPEEALLQGLQTGSLLAERVG